MDVTELLERLAEPAVTARLRIWWGRARATLTAAQREGMRESGGAGAFDPAVMQMLRAELSRGDAVRRVARELAARSGRRGEGAGADPRIDALPLVLGQAAAKPAAMSALVWTWLGASDPELAAHLVHHARELAALPGLRRPLTREDPDLAAATEGGPGRLAHLASHLAELQVDDAAAWLEHVPAPYGRAEAATLAQQVAAIEAARAGAPRLARSEVAGFLRRAAAFFGQLAAQRLDPLGFALAPDASLETDPPLERRLELTRWARRAGHIICPRAPMMVLSIPVAAPWPLALELVATELGRGLDGATAMLLRLAGGGTMGLWRPAPLLVCFADEPADERGARFERWLANAYPHAVDEWRRWC